MPLESRRFGSGSNPALAKINELIAFYTAHPDLWMQHHLTDDAKEKKCPKRVLLDIGAEEVLWEPILVAAKQVTGEGFASVPQLNDDPRTTLPLLMRIFERVRLNLGGSPSTSAGEAGKIDWEAMISDTRIEKDTGLIVHELELA